MNSSFASSGSPYGPEFPNPLPDTTDNILEESDSYKPTHLYSGKGRTLLHVYAWIGSRVGKDGPDFNIFVGQQHIAATIASYRLTKEHVDSMVETCAAHFGVATFNREPYDKIVAAGGRIPMRIWGVREGTKLPRGVYGLIVESTSCPEILLFLEAHLQRIWYSTGVATRTMEYRIQAFINLKKTTEAATATACFPFRIHDFGVRACASKEQAKIGGLAALEVGNLGTDNIPALKYAQLLMPDIDPSTGKPKMPAFSVPAGEHNVAYSRGEEHEMEPVEIALDAYSGLLSWPIDTYNTVRFVDRVTQPGPFRDRLMARAGKFILRPDSPIVDASGAKMDHANTIVTIFERIRANLSDLTPATGGIRMNSKGYFVLPDWLGMIYGDSVTVKDVEDIYALITAEPYKWSAENIVFGVGGNLLQNTVTRGWLDFAMKSSQQIYRDDATGEMIVMDVGKKTPGKESPVGRLKVINREGRIVMVPESDGPEPNMMVCYYDGGSLYNFESLDTIRARVASQMGFHFD